MCINSNVNIDSDGIVLFILRIRVKALEGVHSDYGDTHEDPKLKPPIPPLAGPAPGAILSMSLQVNIDSSGSQYQTQINDHRFPSGVQPWMPISIHNVNSATTMQKTGDLAAPLVVPYLDDKSQIKDAVRMAEIGLKSAGMLDDFKVAIAKYISSSPMSDTNLKVLHKMSGLSAKALVVLPCYVSLEVGQFVIAKLATRREKEEKEAKKRKGLADEFYELLHESKMLSTMLQAKSVSAKHNSRKRYCMMMISSTPALCLPYQQILHDDDILDTRVVSSCQQILNDDDILNASVVSCASTDILNADDILDASVVSSASIDIE
ncbi:hypothetical protein FXO37_21158 [Capsicum annuum]|nr:hypothetical protein FXO37_21158 [Capsicum annuum]